MSTETLNVVKAGPSMREGTPKRVIKRGPRIGDREWLHGERYDIELQELEVRLAKAIANKELIYAATLQEMILLRKGDTSNRESREMHLGHRGESPYCPS